jgi:hemoglobin
MADDAAVKDTQKATPFERLGGEAAIRRIVERFYDVMETDPAAARIRAMHAADLSVMRSKLADWMIGALGGPPLYAQRPDRGCMGSVHKAYPIGEADVEEWMYCLRTAWADENVDPALRELLETPFKDMAMMLRSR